MPLQGHFFIISLLLVSALGYARPIVVNDEPIPRQYSSEYAQFKNVAFDWQRDQLLHPNFKKDFKPADREHLVFARDPGEGVILRYEIENTTQDVQDFSMLKTQNSISFVTFYHIHDGKMISSATDGMKTKEAAFFPLVKFHLPPGTNEIYVYSEESAYYPLYFGNHKSLRKAIERQQSFVTSLFAISVVLVIIAVCLFIASRDMIFFWYGIYAISSSIMLFLQPNIILIYTDQFYQIFDLVYNDVLNFTMILELLATVSFINYYLHIKNWSPRLHRFVIAYTTVATFALVFFNLSYSAIQAVVTSYIMLISAVFLYGLFRRVPNAKKGILSWSVYIVGISAMIYHSRGDILLGMNIGWACLVIEMIVFALLSSYEAYLKIAQMSEEKAHSFSQLKKLVYPEQLDQMMHGKKLEETMPVTTGEACVICFDIENSSALDHFKNHAFFEDFLLRCQVLMNRGIDLDGATHCAFRIKELGDGFLCSVGFPFPVTHQVFQSALEFCYEFHNILQDSAMKFLGHSVSCGIGVSYGEIGGFFPQSGIQHYDLYGRAIVSATRFQEMRKQMKQVLGYKYSLLIIQEQVFRNLSPDLQRNFTEINTNRSNVRVRDHDPDLILYVQQLHGLQLTEVNSA